MRIGQERRMFKRTWLQRSALLIIPGLRGVYSCGIRDLSGQRAGLRLDCLVLLSTDFRLSFDGVRHTFACCLIWREGDFAGIAFQSASGNR